MAPTTNKGFFILALSLMLMLPSAFAAVDDAEVFWDINHFSETTSLNANTNVQTVDGILNGAINFDGNNDYLDVPSLFDTGRNEYTYSIWINPDNANEFKRFVTNSDVIIQQNVGGELEIISFDDRNGIGNYHNYDNYFPLTNGNWFHIVVSTDVSDNTIIYINGVDVTSSFTAATANTATDHSIFKIGSSHNSDFNFDGQMDEFALWSKVLTSGDVSTLYNGGFGRDSWSVEPGYIEYHNAMDLGYDWSGNSNQFTSAFPFDMVSDGAGSAEFPGNAAARIVSTNTLTAIAPSTGRTVSVWFKAEPFVGFDRIVSQRSATNSRDWEINHNGANTIEFRQYNGVSTITGSITGTATDEEWHHLVGVQSGTNMELFIDGVSVGTDTLSQNIPNQARKLTISRAGDTEAGDAFDGNVAKVGVWYKAFDAAEVAEIYNDGVPFNPYNDVQSLQYGLQHYFDFERGTTTTYESDAHDGEELVFTSPVGITPGVIGSAAFYVSNDGFYDFSSAVAEVLVPTKPFTVSFWGKIRGDTGGNQQFFQSNDAATSENGIQALYSRTGATNDPDSVIFRLALNDASTSTSRVKFDNPTFNQFYHYVITHDGDMNLRLYVDGVEQTATPASGGINNEDGRFSMGTNLPTNGNFLNGDTDEFGIWSRELTEGEIDALYNGGAAISYNEITTEEVDYFTTRIVNSFTGNPFSTEYNVTVNGTTYTSVNGVATTTIPNQAITEDLVFFDGDFDPFTEVAWNLIADYEASRDPSVISLDTALEHYWTLDDADGIIPNLGDVHGTNDITTINIGAGDQTPANGILEEGLDLDGTSDYLQTSTQNTFMQAGSDWAVNMWINHDVDNAADTIMMANDADASDDGVEIIITTDQRIQATLYVDNNYVAAVESSADSVTAAEGWEMVTVVGYTNNTIEVYINGELDSTDFTQTGTMENDDLWTFGSDGNDNIEEYDGQMDEIGAWSRALTTQEISELYRNGEALSYDSFAGSGFFQIQGNINNFTADVGAQTYNSVNGTIITDLENVDAAVVDIMIYPQGEIFEEFIEDYNTVSDIDYTFPNTTIIVTDVNSNANITDFNITLQKQDDGYLQTFANQDTTFTKILVNAPFDITVSAAGYFTRSYQDYNVSNNLNVTLTKTDELVLRLNQLPDNTLITENATVFIEDGQTQEVYVIENGTGVIPSLVLDTEYSIRVQTASFEETTIEYTHNQDSANAGQDIFLFPLGSQTISITVRDTIQEPIDGAAVLVEKFVNGVYTTVSQKNTGITGLVTFSAVQGDTHRVTISKEGFETKQFIDTFPLASFTIFLQSTSAISFDNPYTGITFSHAPMDTQVGLGDQTFTFSISAPAANLDYFGLELLDIGGNQIAIANNPGDPDGGNLFLTEDMTPYNNTQVTLRVFFKKSGFDEVSYTYQYAATDDVLFEGTYKELRMELMNLESNGVKFFIWALLTIAVMLIASIFVQGLSNIVITTGFALFFGWLVGFSLIWLAVIAVLVIAGAIAFGNKNLG